MFVFFKKVWTAIPVCPYNLREEPLREAHQKKTEGKHSMSIRYDGQTGVFSLETDHTLYQMKADDMGTLLHLHYGEKTGEDMSYLIRTADRGFCGNPYEKRSDRSYSLDQLPQEYSGNGTGDFRIPALIVRAENGSRTVDLRYAGYEITDGREPLPGLPHVRPAEDTETLTVTLRDLNY